MAKLTLDDLASLANQTTAISTINGNNAAIETALENTLSRDGTSPNEMGSHLDMNGYRIHNLPAPVSAAEPVRLGDIESGGVDILSGLSEYAQDLLESETAADARTALGLGTSAIVNTGTSGATIPLLNGTNTASGVNTFSNTTDATTTSTGAIVTAGGIGAAKQIRTATSANIGTSLTVGTTALIGTSLSIGNATYGLQYDGFGSPQIILDTGESLIYDRSANVLKYSTATQTPFFISPDGFGYPTSGNIGGTVTQNSNKSTAVELNTMCGQITMNNAALNTGVEVTFTVTNSKVAATDVIIVNHSSGGTSGAYGVCVTAVGAGSFAITVSNWSAGNLSEAIVLSFAVIKGSTN